MGNAYQGVYNGAYNSIASLEWADEVQDDFVNYFLNGDQALQFSTPVPVPIVQISTVTPPAISEPVTPDLPLPATDAAVTTYVSMFIIALAVIVNIIV